MNNQFVQEVIDLTKAGSSVVVATASFAYASVQVSPTQATYTAGSLSIKIEYSNDNIDYYNSSTMTVGLSGELSVRPYLYMRVRVDVAATAGSARVTVCLKSDV